MKKPIQESLLEEKAAARILWQKKLIASPQRRNNLKNATLCLDKNILPTGALS